MRKLMLVVCVLALVAATFAQERSAPAPAPGQAPAAAAPSVNPYSDWSKYVYMRIQDILLRSAEKMPEENYAFKPTPEVRSYGQIIGHVADSQYYFCSTAMSEKQPANDIEKTKTSKADLIAALKESTAYCEKAYGAMTDTTGTQIVKLFGTRETPRLSVLTVNLVHDMEHYGNLVTYMRMKNLVPPSSEQQAPQPPPQPQKK